ncbi:MAG: hypothetical protein WCX28_02055 [Bacteriovoracaceae bacterium]|nr:hypothetical protein [Bacteroidota bacterium]
MNPVIPQMLYYSFLILSIGTFILVARKIRKTFPEHRSYVNGLIVWFLAQYLLGKLGVFALGLGEMPPRILFIVVPNFLFIIYLAFSSAGKTIANHLGMIFLTAMQSFRIGVELVLLQLAGGELLPSVMSVEGRNFDALIGLTAPLIAYLYRKEKISRKAMIGWNVAGLVLVTNVVVHGILSMPGIEVIETNVPNFIISYAPFNLLPGVLVPFAYVFHIFSLRKLLTP